MNEKFVLSIPQVILLFAQLAHAQQPYAVDKILKGTKLADLPVRS